MAQRHLEQKIKDSYVKAGNRDEERLTKGALSKGELKGKDKSKCQQQLRERRLHLGEEIKYV